MTTSPLKQELNKLSPCVQKCALDNNLVCKGCGRHINEIDSWNNMSPSDKENVFRIANARLVKKLSKI